MKRIVLFFLFVTFYVFSQAQILVTPAQVSAINTAQSAASGDIYKDTENNVFYIGTSSGLLKIIGDVAKVDASLSGDGSVANPLRISSMGATSGQVLSWNGTSWAPSSVGSGTTSVSNSISGFQLVTTVNGVNASPVNFPLTDINSVGLIALNCDLTGTAWCVRIAPSAVNSDKIQDGEVKTVDLGYGAVTSDKIADGTITTTDIANSQITYPKIQDVTSARLLGNPTGSSAPPSEIVLGTGLSFSGNVLNTTNNTTTVSNSFSGIQLTTTVNSVSASPVSLPVSNVTDLGVIQLTGDLSGTAYWPVIGNSRITYPKIQNVTSARLLGNPTGSSAPPSEIVLGTGLTFSGNVLNASNNGTVTTVTGTSPIVITGTPTSTPNVTITRNNILSGTSSSAATNPLVLAGGATNAVVGGSNVTFTVNNTAPLWNANQLQGRNIATTAPNNGQVLSWNGTVWTPTTPSITLTNKKQVLSAEYPGAVVVPGGSANNNGDMIGDNTGNNTPRFMNYYEWKGRSSSGPQTYQVIVRITLPNDFSEWQPNAIQVSHMVNTGCFIQYTFFNTSTGAAIFTGSNLTNSVWTTTNITNTNLASWITPGETVAMVITFSATNNNVARIGDIVLNYR